MERFFSRIQVDPAHADWSPVVVQTRSFTLPIDPVAYEAVKIMLVRDGSMVLFSEFGKREATVNDLVVLCAATLCGAVPRGTVKVSTAYVDPDYLLDQLSWRHAEVLPDRFAAEVLVERSYHFRAELIHLLPEVAVTLARFLDSIENRKDAGGEGFFQTQATFAGVMQLLAQLMPCSPDKTGPNMHAIALSKDELRARYAPIRAEVLRIEQALQEDLARRWTVSEMAEIVHMSPRHLSRVFREALGRSPISYLATLRAKEMSRLLRETDVSIAEAGRAVGWRSRTRARQAFTKLTGISPEDYRHRFAGADTDKWDQDRDENAPIPG
ncbi:helix-turn-helix transcriptional regulator [Actinomycetaceae bacterium MB13-C1-2]|nr:helix-turn-helix transcriptional regulator [Actinomycetaceae bacterium MB13-C1-2]